MDPHDLHAEGARTSAFRHRQVKCDLNMGLLSGHHDYTRRRDTSHHAAKGFLLGRLRLLLSFFLRDRLRLSSRCSNAAVDGCSGIQVPWSRMNTVSKLTERQVQQESRPPPSFGSSQHTCTLTAIHRSNEHRRRYLVEVRLGTRMPGPAFASVG
jgi:hypothetical protein